MAAPMWMSFSRVFRDLFLRYEARLLPFFRNGGPEDFPALAMAGTPSSVMDEPPAPRGESVLERLLGDGIFWASVPKARRTREKRLKRKHSWTGRQEYYQLKNDILMCPECGGWHQKFAICGTCYAKVREETEAIKAAMGVDVLKYQQPREEVGVVYEGEEELEEHLNDKFIVKIDKKRPTWFHPTLMNKR